MSLPITSKEYSQLHERWVDALRQITELKAEVERLNKKIADFKFSEQDAKETDAIIKYEQSQSPSDNLTEGNKNCPGCGYNGIMLEFNKLGVHKCVNCSNEIKFVELKNKKG